MVGPYQSLQDIEVMRLGGSGRCRDQQPILCPKEDQNEAMLELTTPLGEILGEFPPRKGPRIALR